MSDEVRKIGGIPVKTPNDIDPFQNILIYGDSGTGKTTLLGTATQVPEMRPVLHIDIERGAKVLRGLPTAYIEIVTVSSIGELQKVYDEVYRDLGAFKTITVDNISDTQNIGLNEIWDEDDNDEDRRRRKGRLVFEGMDLEFKHYKKSTEQVRRIIRGFRDLSCHTLFTAHELVDVEEKTKRTTIRPQLTNKAAKMVPGLIDEVWHLQVKGGKRELRTQRSGVVVAKSRGKLPDVITDPDMKTLYSRLAS